MRTTYENDRNIPPLPDLKGAALITLSIDCPSIAMLEFLSPGRAEEDNLPSVLCSWKFAFFDCAVHALDIIHEQTFPSVQGIVITAIEEKEWRFEVNVMLDESMIRLKCRDFYYFDRPSFEQLEM